MNTRETDFESIWWEMEALEPLTPTTSKFCNESDEVPTQSTNWLRVLERQLFKDN